MDSLTQISEESEFAAISEPDLNLDAVEVPDEGPMTFEFDIEVRPEFELPKWKGLKVERPVRDFTDEDVDSADRADARRAMASWSPHDERRRGRRLPRNPESSRCTADGEVVARDEELCAPRCVSHAELYVDGELEGFDKLMIGAEAGEKKSLPR